MSTDFIIKHLLERFKNRKSFTRKELYAFYCEFEPELKETTFRWRIYDLKEKRIISSLATGLFTLEYVPNFYPAVSDSNKKLHEVLSKQFIGLKLCIWSTQILNEFMLHLPGKFYTILEVEKDGLEPVFHYLQDIKMGDVFLQPSEMELERYVKEKEGAVVLKSLISKAPVQVLDGVPTITLEKLIVDIYSDEKTFATYQGSELAHIINNAYNKYALDLSKLYAYAKRRGKEDVLKEYLTKETDIANTILND